MINGNKIGRDFVCGQRSHLSATDLPLPPLPLERSSIKRRAGHTRPRATSAIFQRRETLSRTRLSTWIVAATEPISTIYRSFDRTAQRYSTANGLSFRDRIQSLCRKGSRFISRAILKRGRGGGRVFFPPPENFPIRRDSPSVSISIDRKKGWPKGWMERRYPSIEPTSFQESKFLALVDELVWGIGGSCVVAGGGGIGRDE